MIKVCKPNVCQMGGGKTRLSCRILDSQRDDEREIWFESDAEYGKYFCDEVCDAFVVAVLLPALRSSQDITVEGPMSERLYYNIRNTVIYLFSTAFGYKPIEIKADKLVHPRFDNFAVGCGCSLGVDSFAAMLSHMEDLHPYGNPEGYQITHLTYFNVGAHGYKNLDKVEASYKKDLEMVRAFAQSINRPLVCINSNIHILFDGFNFDQSGDTRNMCAVLSMQKLFKRYLYASSYPIKEFRLTPVQSGYYETVLLPSLSTENTELIVANPNLSRTEKTELLADNKQAQSHLYVCWKELIANNNPGCEIAKIKDKYLNCTRCDKCHRTLMALDIMGKTEDFSAIFDLKHWNSVKDKYIATVLSTTKENGFSSDLKEMMDKYHYQIPFKSKVFLYLHKTGVVGLYHKIRKIVK